jgi:hypothetical protein
MSNRMIVVDLEAAAVGLRVPRFVMRAEIESEGGASEPAWRQLKPFDRHWGTGAGYWERLPDGRILFKGSAQHRNIAYQAMVLQDCRNGDLGDFPTLGQYGLGRLFGTGGMGLYGAEDASRVLWALDETVVAPPDPGKLWVGVAGKFGGQAAIYRAEGLYGVLFNFSDGKPHVWDIYVDTRGWGIGLGASTGITLVIVIGKTPKEVVGTTSQGVDFNLAFAGKIDGYIKTIRNAGGLASDMKLGTLAKTIYSRMEIGKAGQMLHNSARMLSDNSAEDLFNRAKIVCNGLAFDRNAAGFTVIDLPISTPGLELGVVSTTSTVIDAVPWF